MGLAEQHGNKVTLSYRKETFSRIKARNEERVTKAIAENHIEMLFKSEVLQIAEGTVTLKVGEREERVIANDDVFVFAGGKPPFDLLKKSGISFNPADRQDAPPTIEQAGSLLHGLTIALGFALLVLAWALVFRSYYSQPTYARPLAPEHEWLRPSGAAGLTAGILSALLIVANLAYLARRSLKFPWLPGTLARWMTMHVATGIGAFLLVIIHSAIVAAEHARRARVLRTRNPDCHRRDRTLLLLLRAARGERPRARAGRDREADGGPLGPVGPRRSGLRGPRAHRDPARAVRRTLEGLVRAARQDPDRQPAHDARLARGAAAAGAP